MSTGGCEAVRDWDFLLLVANFEHAQALGAVLVRRTPVDLPVTVVAVIIGDHVLKRVIGMHSELHFLQRRMGRYVLVRGLLGVPSMVSLRAIVG